MYAIIGAAGNVGKSTSHALREAGVPVRAIVHNAANGSGLEEIGCVIAVADIQDAAALAEAIADADADAVQIVIPQKPQGEDPLADMHRSIDAILQAVGRAGVRQLLLISDYGAHVDHDIGKPSVFHAAEARFRRHRGDVTILRVGRAQLGPQHPGRNRIRNAGAISTSARNGASHDRRPGSRTDLGRNPTEAPQRRQRDRPRRRSATIQRQ